MEACKSDMADKVTESVKGESHANTSAVLTVNGNATEDHPQGDEIRAQVEYYFSDKNLSTDIFLLERCRGRENLPISTSTICGFKKMRGFKPKRLVIAALRKSPFLEISNDGKTVRRKVPFEGKSVLDLDVHDDEIAYDPRASTSVVGPVPSMPQKGIQNPKGVCKSMLKPTGFEKTYIEPPQTPQEAVEEEAMYDPDRPFVERIEIAIQRFKQRRRMHEMYSHVFNKFMRFGGVESDSRMYQGVSQQDLKDMDAEEVARALAIHHVPWDRTDAQYWIVDFPAVGKAFLSSWYPAHYGLTLKVIENACQVLRSFYNYLLYHEVCPEYYDQLQAARSICDIAEKELPKVQTVSHALPGEFNQSASTLFGGSYAGTYIGNKSWATEMKEEGVDLEAVGISEEVARINFSTGVAIMGSDEQYEMIASNTVKVLKRESTGLEVVSVDSPDAVTKACYEEQSKKWRHKLDRLVPLGKLKCKVWHAADCDEWDLPGDEVKYPGGKPCLVDDGRVYVFWIEETILNDCFVGMKLDAGILTLNSGLTILDSVNEVMCSFFSWLPNELWMERKPREVRWLNKGLGTDEEGNAADDGGDGKEMMDTTSQVGEFDDE